MLEGLQLMNYNFLNWFKWDWLKWDYHNARFKPTCVTEQIYIKENIIFCALSFRKSSFFYFFFANDNIYWWQLENNKLKWLKWNKNTWNWSIKHLHTLYTEQNLHNYLKNNLIRFRSML